MSAANEKSLDATSIKALKKPSCCMNSTVDFEPVAEQKYSGYANKSGTMEHSRATVLPGASYTTSEAVHLPVSKVFSCPKFKVLDVGRAYPQGWPQRFGVVTKPHVHSSDLVNQRMVFVTPEGAETMTIPTPNAAPLGTTPATPSNSTLGRLLHPRIVQRRYPALTAPPALQIDRQQAIENALSMALWHVRHGSGPLSIQAATGRAIRAASMLKQVCADLNSGVTA